MLRFSGFGLKTAAAACAGAFMFMSPASASEPSSEGQPLRGVFFSGVDVVDGAEYFYDGVIVALNRDLSRDGWMLRAYGSRVDYDSGNDEGRGWQGDIMLGYKFTRGPIWGSIFVGADYQNFHNPPNTDSEVDGTEWGFKVAGDLSTAYGSPIYANLSGSYSTAFDSYWVRLRAGLHRDNLTYGPEAIMMGNESFEAQRFGGFITFHNLNPLRMRPFDMTFSGGFQFQSDDNSNGFGTGGGEGAYGAIGFSMVF